MNLNIILNNYKELGITLNTLRNFDKSLTIKSLNGELKELLEEINLLNLGKVITKININENGMFFNLTKLKEELHKYFNLQENNPDNPKIIKNLINSLNDENAFELLEKNYPLVATSFKSTKNASKTRKDKRLFLRQIRKILILFRKLLMNEYVYSTINYSHIDLIKLSLFIAYNVEYQCEEYKTKGEEKKHKKTLEYLKEYINNTKDIIPNNYSFLLKGRPYVYNKIKSYVNMHTPVIKEENIEQINYNFFECNKLDGTRLLKRYFQLGQNQINPDFLQEILKRKIDLYTSINFTKIKLGTSTYSGYIGFVLENGYIILDKLFDDLNTCKISHNNAIYIIKEEDFNNITRLSKTEVINLIKEDTYDITRIIHNGDFEEKVKKHIKK